MGALLESDSNDRFASEARLKELQENYLNEEGDGPADDLEAQDVAEDLELRWFEFVFDLLHPRWVNSKRIGLFNGLVAPPIFFDGDD